MTAQPAAPAATAADSAFLPVANLPKGGLAAHGLGEQCTVSTHTGALSVSVPLATTPGRGASSAELTLGYHSGSGRSPFGFGWDVSTASIGRRTSKQLPTYTDDDTFGLAGGDDLVPQLEADGAGGWRPVESSELIGAVPYRIRRFRPRSDDTHLRIEQCSAGDDMFWRTVDGDNVTRIFGRSDDARIADPGDPTGRRIFQWLLEEVRDDHGNVAVHEYKREDTAGVAPQPGEQHRLSPGAPAPANRYPKRIRYANAVPGDATSTRLLVVFDYGEHDLAPDEARPWPARADAFSVYSAGFEIRTWRLCRRIMVFHDFGSDLGAGPTPRLARTVELTHDTTLSRLTAVRQVGYRWAGSTYDTAALAPLEFEYVDARASDHLQDAALHAVPEGSHVRFVDLHGDGLPGVLTTTPGGWWYQPPAGDATFDPPVPVRELPSTGYANGVSALRDIDATGRIACVSEEAGLFGSSIRRPDGSWDRFRPFVARAVTDLSDVRLERLDLDGDGLADLVRRGPDELLWTAARGRDGYGPTMRIPSAADEADGPRPPSIDPTHEWFRADMSGDGLADVVRIRAGRVDYWPDLGWGRYGARITMTGTLTLDDAEHFDGARVRLADLDGTGAADLIYLGDRTVTVWRNRSGTAWSTPEPIGLLPRVDNLDELQVLDLLGAGTPCLVWTTSAVSGPVVRYLDLAVDGKPNLLRRIVNNLGARTVVDYDTSVRQELAARRAGRPWATSTSSAAVVVGALRASDEVSQSEHVTRYTYRDSWFDPVERESRGFAYVETSDAESFGAGGGTLDLPPVRTCEWFATGRPGDAPTHTFAADPDAITLEPHLRVGVTGATEYQQSARAIAGRQVRSETYVDDGGSLAPTVVTQTRLLTRQLQPGRADRPAAFRVEPLESTSAHYERTFDDPRVTHELTLDTDDHGTPTSTVSAAYPRRVPAIDEQSQVLVSWSVAELTSADTPGVHRISEATAHREYEITGVPVPPSGAYRVPDLVASVPTLAERDFAAVPTPGLTERRLVSAHRYEFWNDALSAALPIGQIGSRALVRRVLRFALSPLLVTSVFGPLVTPQLLGTDGGYEVDDTLWWLTDGVRHYDPSACYLPSAHATPFGNTADVTYDTHHLLVARVRASTTAPLSLNAVQVANDYQALVPVQLTDGNGVRNRVAVDPLGRVISTWRIAPDGSGDTDALPGAVFTYGSDSWRAGTGPSWSHSATRERHADAAGPWQEQRLYVDGLGRIALTKSKAEPGAAFADDGAGGAVSVDTTPNPRWIGSGRTVFDNKGQAVEQYDPYFAVGPEFDDSDALVKHALSQRRRYDALGRLVRVDHPDGTLETVEIGPWQQRNSDRNDTVLASTWFAQRQSGGAATAAQQRAATLAAANAGTPARSLCDPLGRVVRVYDDNGADGSYETRFVLDLGGDIVEVHDARGVRAGTQTKDAAGRPVRTESIDAGTQRALADAAGRHLRHFTPAGHVVTCGYDLLGRPTELRVRNPGSAVDQVAELTVYGEGHPQAAARCLVGQVHRRYDRAGLSRADHYDLSGNLVDGTRQLLSAPAEPDWAALVGQPLVALDAAASGRLDSETFTATGEFDALSRPVREHLADGTTILLGYGGGGLLARIGAQLGASAVSTAFVAAVEYDAKRRRTQITHGNGVVSTHGFDELSGRAEHLSARRGATVLQDLDYTYDPVGNVVQIDDAAAQTIFFAGAVVAPGSRFTYDPVYRLRTASGREHASLGTQPDSTEPALPTLPHPNDANALRNYTETYTYDSVGNITAFAHAGTSNSWTRRYEYTAGTNLLAAHQLPGNADAGPYTGRFSYDAAGNTTQAPTITALTWDHAGKLATTDLGGGGTVTFHYDGGGARVRKIWQRLGGLREERIYLGPLELFRRYRSDKLVFERRTVRVLDGRRTEAIVETVTVDTDHPGFDATPRIRHQLSDLLGSSALECDEAGTVISYEEFHPFGTTSLWLARGAAAVSIKRYRYVGKEKDEETGFYVLGARYYCAWLGRWLSPDPAGLIDGVNRYCYVSNNPVSHVDLTGLAGNTPTWKPQQMFFVESKALRFSVKSTPGGDGFTPKHYDYAEKLAERWGGAPPNYHLGHAPETPLWSQKAGTVSEVGIQSWQSNLEQSVVEKADAAAARARGDFARFDRKTTQWVDQPPPKGWQPPLPELAGSKPLTVGGKTAATTDAAAAAGSAVKPLTTGAGAVHGPPGQLELPGVNTKQLTLRFDRPATGPGAAVAPKAAPTGAPPQLELFTPPAANHAGDVTKTADMARTADVATDSAAASKATSAATDATTVVKGADRAAPVLDGANSAGVVTKDATAVAEVTKDAGKVAEVTKDASKVAEVTKDASRVAEVTKDAGIVTKLAPVATDAQAVSKVAKTVAPVAKTVAPIVKEAGALTKIVSGGAKVLKVVAPVAKVIGEVAKPLGVAVAAVDLVTAPNNSERLVAAGDLTAGVAMYCGPVGEAFSAGYTVGGLADKGIEKASKAAFGVDLSPSNGLSHVMDAQDKLVSAIIPDDPKQPAYKNENKVAWFLIDHLGF